MRRKSIFLAAFLCAAGSLAAPSTGAPAGPRFRPLEVLRVSGTQVPGLLGSEIGQLAAFACEADGCRSVAMQVDERDPALRWVLDAGPAVGLDDQPGSFDANDEILLRADSAGRVRWPAPSAVSQPGAEVVLADPLSGETRFVYLIRATAANAASAPAPAAYDVVHDRLSGTRVALGFADGIPQFLSIDAGPNLLDRLKVRAHASALFGLLRFTRSEADLTTEFLGWRAGPLRVIRAQRQRVRLGFGVRSPAFVSYTYFYGDWIEMPVTFRLNFPATYFFTDITVQAVLDFRDLRGAQVWIPGAPAFEVDGVLSAAEHDLAHSTTPYVVVTHQGRPMLLRFDVSPSLQAARRRVVYREALSSGAAPDPFPGSLPEIGFELDRFESVGAGTHELSARAYLLPDGADAAEYIRQLDHPLDVGIVALPSTAD